MAGQKSVPADVEEVKPAAKRAKPVAGLGALLHRAVYESSSVLEESGVEEGAQYFAEWAESVDK